MRKSSVVAAAILALSAAGWVLSGQVGSGTEHANPTSASQAPARADDAASAERRQQVRVADLDARPRVESVRITGRTEASRRVDLRAETEGRVVELLARRGDAVKAGRPLVRLDMADRRAKLAEAKATLRQREIEYEAARRLHERGFRSTTEKAAASARLDGARAVVEQIEIDIARTTIKAPYDGIVDAGHVELGDYVRAGDIAARVVDLDPVLVIAYASERQVGALIEGMSGWATLIDGRRVDGIVRFVSPVADPRARTYRIEVEVANPDGTVRDGLTATLVVPVREARAHLVTPSLLTLNDEGIVGVRTVGPDDRVRFYPVEILADEPDGVWLGGLPERIRLITVGQEFVVDGQPVTPVEGDARIVPPGST